MVLEETFRTKKYPTSAEKLATAEVTGLSKYQVHVWLQNRRMKWKNSRGAEIGENGGKDMQWIPDIRGLPISSGEANRRVGGAAAESDS